MSISKNTFLDGTANALAEQTKYNDLRYAKKGETSGGGAAAEMNITVGNVQPEGGLWFNTYTTFFSTYSTTAPTGGDDDE